MKAMRIHSYGDVDALHLDDVPVPVPGPGQALVRVAATTFNPVDVALRSGAMAELFPLSFPYTPGLEISGTVVTLGPVLSDPGGSVAGSVSAVAAGDHVVAFLPLPVAGGAAEFAVVDTALLAPAPSTVPLPEAAALPVAALTADQALFKHGNLSTGAARSATGRRVLVNGAGGVVGGVAVQLAKQAGATVIATASARSATRVKALGADEVLDHTTTPIAEWAIGRVDLIVNLAPVAPADFGPLTDLLAGAGRAVTAVPIGIPSGETRWTFMNAHSDSARLAELSAAVDRGDLSLHVAAQYPLSELATVQTLGAAGETRGKLIVVVAG